MPAHVSSAVWQKKPLELATESRQSNVLGAMQRLPGPHSLSSRHAAGMQSPSKLTETLSTNGSWMRFPHAHASSLAQSPSVPHP